MASCSTDTTDSQTSSRSSHASRKVKWCLRKAKKELSTKGYHRGLIKAKPDIRLAEQHIAKAKHNLDAAHYFHKGGFSDWSASAFFYTLYHCFLAILQRYGYTSRNQECTIACIELLRNQQAIALDTEFIDALKLGREQEHSILGLREHYQYGIELEFSDHKELKRLTLLCKEMLHNTRDILHGREP